MNILQKQYLLPFMLALVFVLAGVVYIGHNVKRQSPGAQPDMHVRHIMDFRDDRKVIGAADHVFVAKVTRFLGHTYEAEVLPVSAFEAEIVHNIKGELAETVRVVQVVFYKEYNPETGEATIDEGSLLHVGETYLLATRCMFDEPGEPEGCVISTHPNGSHLLKFDPKLDTRTLRSQVANHAKVRAWERAYPNEILWAGDVEAGRIKNSYHRLKGMQPQVSDE